MGEKTEQLHLNILSVSRKLFEEAHSVLWETNRFTFHQHAVFHFFLKSLNSSQKQKIRQILLVIDTAEQWQLGSGTPKHVAALRDVTDVDIILQPKRILEAKSKFSTSEVPRITNSLLGLASLNMKRCSLTLLGPIRTYNGPGTMTIMDVGG